MAGNRKKQREWGTTAEHKTTAGGKKKRKGGGNSKNRIQWWHGMSLVRGKGRKTLCKFSAPPSSALLLRRPFLWDVLLWWLTEKQRRQIFSLQPLLATNEFKLYPKWTLHWALASLPAEQNMQKPDLWSSFMSVKPRKKKNTRTNLNAPLFLTIPLNWKTLHSNAATYTVNLPNVITKFLH